MRSLFRLSRRQYLIVLRDVGAAAAVVALTFVVRFSGGLRRCSADRFPAKETPGNTGMPGPNEG